MSRRTNNIIHFMLLVKKRRHFKRFVLSGHVVVFVDDLMMLKFRDFVQALWAGAVGASPLPNVLVNRIPKWV